MLRWVTFYVNRGNFWGIFVWVSVEDFEWGWARFLEEKFRKICRKLEKIWGKFDENFEENLTKIVYKFLDNLKSNKSFMLHWIQDFKINFLFFSFQNFLGMSKLKHENFSSTVLGMISWLCNFIFCKSSSLDTNKFIWSIVLQTRHFLR